MNLSPSRRCCFAPSARQSIFISMLATLALIVALARPAAAQLEPDQIALVVNDKAPAGRELAEYYAAQRHIPDGRIITVSLNEGNPPNPDEEMPFADYEAKVAQPIRKFLEDKGLQTRVRCLVTFWGLPLRIARRVPQPQEGAETVSLKSDLDNVRPHVEELVVVAEKFAQQLDPNFKPEAKQTDLEALQRRADAAMRVSLGRLQQTVPGPDRARLFTQFIGTLEQFIGSDPTLVQTSAPPLSSFAAAPTPTEQVAAARQRLMKVQTEIGQAGVATSDGRATQRRLAADQLGLFGYIAIVKQQMARIDVSESESSLDNELSLLWWRDNYVRARWQANPLYWRFANAQTPGPVLMVCRLDAPTTQIVHKLIDTCIAVEQKGLTGQVALDARGIAAETAYGNYDQTLRNLANILKAKTSLQVTLDDKDPLFPPNSQKDVALYCGWYSLRHYVPCCVFAPGAVGFHVASFELASLHNPAETGWVHGLMTDGVVATLGPVAEPYLHSFPRADEFFPLLLTGKLPLADVYWRTNPLTSWMNACIGDPLYTPYKNNPALLLTDLPRPLELALKMPPATTRPIQPENPPTQSEPRP